MLTIKTTFHRSSITANCTCLFALANHPQVTKSIVSLLMYYGWKKFSIIHEEMWKNVAVSLENQAQRNNLTVNHVEEVIDYHKCCENNLDCCRSGYWYTVLCYYINN